MKLVHPVNVKHLTQIFLPLFPAPAAKKKAVTFQFSRHGEEARLRAIARSRKILSKASLRLESIDTTSTDLVNSSPEEGTCYHSRYAPHYSPLPSSLPSRAIATQRRFGSRETLDASSSGGRSVLTVESRETRDGTGNMASILFYEKGNRHAVRAQCMDSLEESEMEELVSGGRAASGDETDVSPSSPAGGTPSFFVLLLCPTSRIFELVEVSGEVSGNEGGGKPSNYPAMSTVGDVLQAASAKCNDDRLSAMEFVGLVRPSDRAEFTSRDAEAFAPIKSPVNERNGGEDEFIREDDVLVAVLESHTGSQMVRLSRAILKNERFRDMVRRRRKVSAGSSADDELFGSASKKKGPGGHRGAGGSGRSVGSRSSRRSKSSRGSNRPPRTPGLSDDDSFFSAKSSSLRAKRPASGRPRRGGKQPSKDDKYSSLCRKLEDLSRRLHEIDDEILGDDGESSVVSASGSTSGAFDAGVDFLEKNKQELTTISESLMTKQTRKLSGKKFRMTTHMVAHELASNIEEIFADHDVDIVAVDAADDDDDETTVCSAGSEDGTFVSARSMRSARSLVSHFDQGDRLPTTLEFKPKVRMSRFDEEDDMMAQIEAMAAEADLAFEKRRQGSGPTAAGATGSDSLVVEGKRPVTSDRENASEEVGTKRGAPPSDAECGVTNSALSPDDVLGTLRSTIRPGAEAATDITVTTTQQDALSRNFLNASTSMVSTMVAASEGRVNEVHVLQYLGVTMVCIAANFAQSVRGAAAAARGDAPPPRGSARMDGKELMQSAMFLAFMVNGQRYLAKVTKK